MANHLILAGEVVQAEIQLLLIQYSRRHRHHLSRRTRQLWFLLILLLVAEADKVVLETARFLKDDFLQQNSFTPFDKYCPFYKSVEMMRNIVTFHRLATAAVEKTAAGNSEGQKITYNVIKQRLGDVLYKVTAQKFEDPGASCSLRCVMLHYPWFLIG